MNPYVIAGIAAGYLFATACAGAYCSTEKGRPWLEGFLLGALFGPFGIVSAACLPRIKRPEIGDDKQDEEAPEVDVTAVLTRIKGSRRYR
jgi:hypothetical protein